MRLCVARNAVATAFESLRFVGAPVGATKNRGSLGGANELTLIARVKPWPLYDPK
jgi:hypothetical protein